MAACLPDQGMHAMFTYGASHFETLSVSLILLCHWNNSFIESRGVRLMLLMLFCFYNSFIESRGVRLMGFFFFFFFSSSYLFFSLIAPEKNDGWKVCFDWFSADLCMVLFSCQLANQWLSACIRWFKSWKYCKQFVFSKSSVIKDYFSFEWSFCSESTVAVFCVCRQHANCAVGLGHPALGFVCRSHPGLSHQVSVMYSVNTCQVSVMYSVNTCQVSVMYSVTVCQMSMMYSVTVCQVSVMYSVTIHQVSVMYSVTTHQWSSVSDVFSYCASGVSVVFIYHLQDSLLVSRLQ